MALHTEFEATFENINKDVIRQIMQRNNAKIIHTEQLLRRIAFNLPTADPDAWVRVRDEFGKITMTYKNISGGVIDGQKEIEIIINNFQDGVDLLEKIGCVAKSYQETLRETWETKDAVIVTLDTWPFLDPFIEIEGNDELSVRNTALELGLDWEDAIFDSVTVLYSKKYNISKDRINNQTPRIVFDMDNPFL